MIGLIDFFLSITIFYGDMRFQFHIFILFGVYKSRNEILFSSTFAVLLGLENWSLSSLMVVFWHTKFSNSYISCIVIVILILFLFSFFKSNSWTGSLSNSQGKYYGIKIFWVSKDATHGKYVSMFILYKMPKSLAGVQFNYFN